MVEETVDSGELAEQQYRPAPVQIRFQLWHLFYVTALLAICLVLSGWMLYPAALWFIVCAFAANAPSRANSAHVFLERFARLMIGSVVCCCLLGVFLPLGHPRHAAQSTRCANNMRIIMLAMLNYESANMQFPTPSETDSAGKPMHSWRVRILPYLEQQKLYDQYDFDQPWDSPHNLKLVDQMPDVFRCPLSKETSRTGYKLVVGPGSLFDEGVRPTFWNLKDGSSNTYAIVEDGVNPVKWTRPSDLTVDQALAVLKPDDAEDFPHVHDSTFETNYFPGNSARFDGSVDYGTDCCELHRSAVRTMLTVNDGQVLDEPPDPEAITSKHVSKPGPWIALALFFLMMFYPLTWVFRRASSAAPTAGI